MKIQSLCENRWRACASPLIRVSETRIFRRLARHLVKNPEQQFLFRSTSLFSSLGAAIHAGINCASCGVGTRPCVYINELGDVFPCANTQKEVFKLGNIKKTIWLIALVWKAQFSEHCGHCTWNHLIPLASIAMCAGFAAEIAAERPIM